MTVGRLQILRGSFARAVYVTAGSNGIIALASALSGILAARLLGPEGRGEFAAAVVWAGILGTIAQLGLPQAITYHTARSLTAIRSIMAAVLALTLVQSAVIVIAGWVLAGVWLGRSQPDAVAAVRLYLFSIPAALLITHLSTLAQGAKHFKAFSAFRVLSSLGFLVALILAYELGYDQAVEALALVLIAQIAVAALALVWFWRWIVGGVGPWQSQWVPALLRYGIKSYFGSLSWIANARLDQFVMSFTVSLAALGYYAVAVSYAGVFYPLLAAFANVLFPHVAAGDRQSARAQVRRVLLVTLAVASAGALFLALIAPLALPLLFGDDYLPALPAAYLLLAAGVFLGGNYVLSDALRGLGQPLTPTIAEFCALAVTLIGLAILLPRLGIMGAAWTSLASYATSFVILFIAANRLMGWFGRAQLTRAS